MSSTVSRCTYVLILFFMCQRYGAEEQCDFIKCVLNIRSFISELRKEGTPFVCRKFANISECSDYCMHKYYPDIFSHSNTNPHTFTQYCVENIAYRSNVNWTCIARHTFRLLTCLANVSSMTSNNVREDAVLKESCRKSLEFSNCPSKVLLPDCGVKTVEVVKDMLQFATDYFMPSSCKEANIKKILSMQAHYHLEHDFMEVARCFDNRLIEIGTCFHQLIQNEMDLYQFVCGDNYLSNCIHFEVAKDCKEVPSVKKLLLKMFSLGGIRCEQSQFAFAHLTSHKFQSSIISESIPNSERNLLSDEIYNFSDKLETSTLQMVKNKGEVFHHKSSTESSLSVYSMKNETQTEISIKNHLEEKIDVKNVNDTNSFDLKNHASSSSVKKPEKHSNKNIEHYEASNGVNLHIDRTLFTAIFLIICIFRMLIH